MFHVEKSKRKLNMHIITAVLLALVLLIVPGVFAKYISSLKSGYDSMEAAKLYFSLSAEPNTVSERYDSFGSIRLYAYNYEGINISELNSSFKVSVSGEGSEDAEITIDGAASDTAQLAGDGSTLK